jgi:hypothetical protein
MKQVQCCSLLLISEASRSVAIFGGDKAEWWNCVTPQSLEECSRRNSSQFLTIPHDSSRFLVVPREFFTPVNKLLLVYRLRPSVFFFNFYLSLSPPLSHDWQTSDFIFARGYIHAHIFRLDLSPVNTAHTCHLYNQTPVHVHYDDGERRRECGERIRQTERILYGKGGRREIYFYGRDGDVLFLHDRIFFSFSWRATEQVRERKQKVRIKRQSTSENIGAHVNFTDARQRPAELYSIFVMNFMVAHRCARQKFQQFHESNLSNKSLSTIQFNTQNIDETRL